MIASKMKFQNLIIAICSLAAISTLTACNISAGIVDPDDGYHHHHPHHGSDRSDDCFMMCNDYSEDRDSNNRDSDNPPRYDGRNDDRPVSDQEREARDAERRGHHNVYTLQNAKILARKYELPFDSALALEQIIARLELNDISLLQEMGLSVADLAEIQQGYFPKTEHMIKLSEKLNLSVYKTYELVNKIKTNLSKN